MLAAIAPCVEHLIVSIVNFTDADPVFHALAMLFLEGDERPVFSSRFKFEFRVRHLDPGEVNEDQCATLAAEWRLRRDQLSIVQDEAAGILSSGHSWSARLNLKHSTCTAPGVIRCQPST